MGNFKISKSTIEKWIDDLEFMYHNSHCKTVKDFIQYVYESNHISYNQTAITLFEQRVQDKLILEFEIEDRYGNKYLK